MKSICIPFALAPVLALVFVEPASAQTTVPVTLQFPSFTAFGVDTTVVVPDSGRGYLGRVNRVNRGRTSAGVPFGNKLMPGLRNHATGGETAHAGIDATATILDRTELDPYTREATFAGGSAARDENDRAGLAIDYLRARHATALARRSAARDFPAASRLLPSRPASGTRTRADAALPRERRDVPETTGQLSRSRGLLNFDGGRRLESSSLLSRCRQSLRTREFELARRQGSGRSLPAPRSSALQGRTGRNYRVYPAPAADATGRSEPADPRSRPSGGESRP